MLAELAEATPLRTEGVKHEKKKYITKEKVSCINKIYSVEMGRTTSNRSAA
jgi:hypothetical protein